MKVNKSEIIADAKKAKKQAKDAAIDLKFRMQTQLHKRIDAVFENLDTLGEGETPQIYIDSYTKLLKFVMPQPKEVSAEIDIAELPKPNITILSEKDNIKDYRERNNGNNNE